LLKLTIEMLKPNIKVNKIPNHFTALHQQTRIGNYFLTLTV